MLGMDKRCVQNCDPSKSRFGRGLCPHSSGASWSATLSDSLWPVYRVILGALVLAAAPLPSDAHPLSLQECLEGGDFIAHAAEARDNGMAKDTFNDKLIGDMYLIQAFPPELRWFVQDPEDAEFLVAEATTVFDLPQAPEGHRTDFLSRCFDRKLGTQDSGPSQPDEVAGRQQSPGKSEPRR